ncbi:MAG: DUF3373 family protein, partial [Campylobacterota bacterium]
NDFFGFWAETKAFASVAFSNTDPKDSAGGMLGTTESKAGQSYYIGAQMPDLLTDDGRFGLEYNYGSKYWRSFTYGEDTVIGSKLAARGHAYEAYWNKPLIKKHLDFQLRYTYIDYEYTGSDMFFGGSGTPNDADTATAQSDPVTTAQNVRAYIRYRF